jgi:hypothetical protein
MIQQIIKQRYFLVISRFVSVFLHSSKVAAADESPPVLALYRILRSDLAFTFLPETPCSPFVCPTLFFRSRRRDDVTEQE